MIFISRFRDSDEQIEDNGAAQHSFSFHFNDQYRDDLLIAYINTQINTHPSATFRQLKLFSDGDTWRLSHGSKNVRGRIASGFDSYGILGRGSLSGNATLSSAVSSTTSLIAPSPRPTSGSVVFRVNRPNGTSARFVEAIELGDVDRDTVNDFGYIGQSGHLNVHFGNQQIATEIPDLPDLAVTSPGTVIDAASGDFDGDGEIDLAVSYTLPSSDNEVAIFLDVSAQLQSGVSTLDVRSADKIISGNSASGFCL